MLRALGKKLILKPAPYRQASDGGLHLLEGSDPVSGRIYLVVSAGPKVTIQGLSHGCRVLATGYNGQSFDFEGHQLRVMDEAEIVMVLP